MPCIGSWPFTLLVTFVVDVDGLHRYGAKNSPLEEPLGARITPLHINVVHHQCEIFPPRPAPPKVTRERWLDLVLFIRIMDVHHRFIVQVCYLAVHIPTHTNIKQGHCGLVLPITRTDG